MSKSYHEENPTNVLDVVHVLIAIYVGPLRLQGEQDGEKSTLNF